MRHGILTMYDCINKLNIQIFLCLMGEYFISDFSVLICPETKDYDDSKVSKVRLRRGL